MPFTRPWDNTLPLGNVLDANDLDGEFRRLKEDIDERLTDSLFVDFAADPLILKPAFGENSKRRNIDASKFLYNVVPLTFNDLYLEFRDDATIGHADVELPDAVEVTSLLPYYGRVEVGAGTASGEVSLLSINHGTQAVTTIATSGALTSTGFNNPITNFSHIVDLGNNWYKLKFVLTNPLEFDTFRFSMVSLLYTNHNPSETL